MKQLALTSPGFLYLESSFKEWLDVLGYSTQTMENLPTHVRAFLHYLESQQVHKIEQVEVKDFESFYQQIKTRPNTRKEGGLSNAYLNKYRQALVKFADYLRQVGKVNLPALNLPSEEMLREEVEVLELEEVKELFEAIEEQQKSVPMAQSIQQRDAAILSVFYGCGLRRNEGYHLDVQDINYARKLIHVRKGKGRKERMVPFNDGAKKHLITYQYEGRSELLGTQQSNAYFISIRKNRMSDQSLNLRLKALQGRTENEVLKNKRVSLHVLRHSIATHLLNSGMELEKIAQFLGHSTLDSTQIYTRIS